jgi:hypothetical protein
MTHQSDLYFLKGMLALWTFYCWNIDKKFFVADDDSNKTPLLKASLVIVEGMTLYEAWKKETTVDIIYVYIILQIVLFLIKNKT